MLPIFHFAQTRGHQLAGPGPNLTHRCVLLAPTKLNCRGTRPLGSHSAHHHSLPFSTTRLGVMGHLSLHLAWFPSLTSITYETVTAGLNEQIVLSQGKQRHIYSIFTLLTLHINQTHFEWSYTSWHNKRSLKDNPQLKSSRIPLLLPLPTDCLSV